MPCSPLGKEQQTSSLSDCWVSPAFRSPTDTTRTGLGFHQEQDLAFLWVVLVFVVFFFPSSLTQDASNPSKGTMGEPLLMLGVKYPQDGFKTGLCAVPRGGASPCLVSSSAGAKSWARCQVCDPCQRGRDLESKVELLLCERWPEIPSKTTERSLFLPMPTGLPSPRACGRPQGCSAREQEG